MSEWSGGHAVVNMSTMLTNIEPSPNRKPFCPVHFCCK